jgi:hypothetical protein
MSLVAAVLAEAADQWTFLFAELKVPWQPIAISSRG